METVLNKLQEGVKYPRFERDATHIINELVEHITEERGIYSSDIEPNPNEHSIWFNTNDNTLYIYNGYIWKNMSNNNIEIYNDDKFYPYPVINTNVNNIPIGDWNIDRNSHYVIIINTDNIRKYLNNIVIDNDDIEFIIIGDSTNTNGTFLINIYDTCIYYIKLSSFYIKEDNVFYCNDGILYYKSDYDDYGDRGIDISGFYTKERLTSMIENTENKSLDDLYLNSLFIEPEDGSTIIIGTQNLSTLIILGDDLDNADIYMYNNVLHIGGNYDDITPIDDIDWYDIHIYCNCKNIGNITITHEESTINLYISTIYFIVGNNNTLTIDQSVASDIDECYIYVINEIDNDKSKVLLPDYIGGSIQEYVNLCGTPLNGTGACNIECRYFITTTIDDIDRPDRDDMVIDFNDDGILIIDAKMRTFTNIEYINYLKMCTNLKIYVTDMALKNYLYSKGLNSTFVTKNNYQTNNYVHVEYKYNSTAIYKKNIYKY